MFILVKVSRLLAILSFIAMVVTALAIPTVAVAGSNADLSALKFEFGNSSGVYTEFPLTPAFNGSTTGYNILVPPNISSSVRVTPVAADSSATVVCGPYTISATRTYVVFPLLHTRGGGSSVKVITAVVTAQDGITKKTYTVIVTELSNYANLSTLVPSAGTLAPSFAGGTVNYPGITTYTASVGNETASITLTPTLQDITGTVMVNGVAVASGSPSSLLPLAVGINTLTTTVTAGDGASTKTYTITMTRAGSSNANLASLLPSDGSLSPPFTSGTTSYTSNVGNSMGSITLTPTSMDIGAIIQINGVTLASGSSSPPLPLLVGDNTVTTVVTAQDGVTTKSYTLTISRLDPLNSWRSTYFPGSSATTGSGANMAAPHGDGVTNLMKFSTGMDPTKPGLMPGSLSQVGNNLLFIYTPSAMAVSDGVTFVVEYSDTLMVGSWLSDVVSQGTIGSGGNPVTASVPRGANNRRALRLRVTAP